MALLDQIISAEGTGKNPNSSASGIGQFINSTWLETVKKSFPQVAEGKTDQQLLAMKSDPQFADFQRAVTAAKQQSNQEYLTSKGFDSTPGNTYLAHFAGPGGAVAVLSNPSAPVEQTLGQAAVDANPYIKGMTGAQLAQWADSRVNGQPTSGAKTVANDPSQQPQGLLGLLGLQNPFGGTNGTLAQPVNLGGGFSLGGQATPQPDQQLAQQQGLNIGTPLGNISLNGGGQTNPALAALQQPQDNPFGSLAPAQPQRRPFNPQAFAAPQIPRLGLLS